MMHIGFSISVECFLNTGKASVTIFADFGPEFNPQFRWRSKHQTKNHCAYHLLGLF